MNKLRLRRLVWRAGAVLAASFVFMALPLGQVADDTSIFCFAKPAQAADEPWEQEFNDVCSRTADSMSLSREELQLLIARCEKLKPIIEGLEETSRKVYRKRLEMCKNLLVFVLESKK